MSLILLKVTDLQKKTAAIEQKKQIAIILIDRGNFCIAQLSVMKKKWRCRKLYAKKQGKHLNF